ncbi:TPA: hypothetical protein TXL52_000321 [Streptococcus suis]|nr:hypothetical protein [Streptococcus suis]
MKNNLEITWADIYREWEVYAEHFHLYPLMSKESKFQVVSPEMSRGSLLTFQLLNHYLEDEEKYAAVWLASFCRDLMQDYAYLLNSRAYMLVSQVYFQSVKQFDDGIQDWAKPLTRLQPKLFISHRMFENVDLTNLACLVELAMIQASLVQAQMLERM